MYKCKSRDKYISDLLKRKGIKGPAAQKFLKKLWG